MNYKSSLLVAIIIAIFFACSEEEPGSVTPPVNSVVPELSVQAITVTEIDGGVTTEFEIKANRDDFTKEVTFDYKTNGITAEPGVDFVSTSGNFTMPAGSSSVKIGVEILNDNEREIDEEFSFEISNPQNATIGTGSNIGIIRDNDPSHLEDEEGYNTPSSYFGYNMTFEETFESGILDDNLFNYELGNGCNVDLCGWGNNELQEYTDEFGNIKIEDEKMVITATKEEAQPFKSARLTTQDKLEFKFGRIDIRAKLPEGQGLWPALWMLGSNIDEVGWPACGEIDIMELVGDKPNQVAGTAHWGAPDNPSTFISNSYNDQQKFSQSFHVFTMIWELNEMNWYVDDTKYHTIDRNSVSPANYPFNQDFFFIFNVAVGGNLPGNPDETTVFPQSMEIDYIRVFQEN